MVQEHELPKRATKCMECETSFKKKPQGASFLKINLYSIKRIDLCEECAQKKKKSPEVPSALWQWMRRKNEGVLEEPVSFQELVDKLFSPDSSLNEQEKFVLAHVLKRGRIIRQRSKTKEHLVLETIDKSKMLSLKIPKESFQEEAFLTVHNLFVDFSE
jgi:hypothetical protein